MSSGQHCTCDACDFDFHSGHSHHAGFSQMLCLACLADYALPTASPWGPGIGELIVVHRLLRDIDVFHKKKPPRITFRLEPTKEFLIAEKGSSGWGVDYPIGHVICPQCEREGTMVLDFVNGQACPACRHGVLDCREVQY